MIRTAYFSSVSWADGTVLSMPSKRKKRSVFLVVVKGIARKGRMRTAISAPPPAGLTAGVLPRVSPPRARKSDPQPQELFCDLPKKNRTPDVN